MDQKTIWQGFSKLPPEAQQQVIDFIAFLQTRNLSPRPRKTIKASKLEKEAFIGLWQNRADMQDSTKWVRDLREQGWNRQ